MLSSGLDHAATITHGADQLADFYVEVFDATIEYDGPEYDGGPRMLIVNIGPSTELNVFELPDNEQSQRVTPMFGRGKIDHLAFRAADGRVFRTDPGATDRP